MTNGLIYKLCCLDPTITDVYVGSTVNFRGRKGAHKSKCNTSKGDGLRLYEFIRANGGFENWDMIVLEYNIHFIERHTLCSRERYWLEKLNASLNSIRPIRTNTDARADSRAYYNANREQMIARVRHHQLNNRTETLAVKNKRVECDCGITHSASNKINHLRTLKHKAWQDIYEFITC